VVINNSSTFSEKSPLTSTHWKRPRHMTLEIQVLGWDRHQNVEGLNLLLFCLILYFFI